MQHSRINYEVFDEKNWDYVNVPKGWLDTYAKEDTVPELCGRENIPIKFIRIEYSTVKELAENLIVSM